MKNVKRLLLLVLFYTGIANGQTLPTIAIKGKTTKKNTEEPVAFVTVRLLDQQGKTVLQTVSSDSTGQFSFRVSAGNYQIKAEAAGYKAEQVRAVAATADVTLANIAMTEESKELEQVTVVAEKSDVELKTDKKVFNVGKDILSRGGNATDVLGNVPSVAVDMQGNVSLRGNGNVRVLIDGKQSMLTANNGLRQLPAASIEKIEVITNPSAAYESQGSAGIINIILKKNNQYGFNASLQAGLGSPANHSMNLNMSYKTKKFNLFSNIGYRYVEVFNSETIRRMNYKNGQTVTLNQYNKDDNKIGFAMFYIGADYYINARNTITGSYNYRSRNNRTNVSYDYKYLDNGGQLDSSLLRLENYREPQIYNAIELNYVKTFKKPGRKWTTSVQYAFWNDDENQSISQQQTFPHNSNVSQMVTRDIESSNDVFIQSDYVAPLKKDAKLEMGLRGDLRAIRSEYKVTLDGAVIDQYDNKLFYDENIYGAYVQYSNKLKKLDYLAGLRSELSNISIADRKGFDKTKNYINLFPTLHLQYNMKNSFEVQLSYSRRINRPRFWQLNTFGGLSDTRNIITGNPDLDPMYTNSFELGALKKTNKLTLNPAVYYQHSTNYFDYIVQQTADGYFVRTPVNLGGERRYGVEFSTVYNPFKWWRLSADFNFYKFTQDGSYQGKDYSVEAKTWFTTFRSGMRFPKVVSVDFSLNYTGKSKNVQSDIKAQYQGNLGLSRDLLADKLSVALTVNNMFDSRDYRQVISTPEYYFDTYSQRLGRQYTGTVIYRFNRKKEQRDRLPTER